MKTNENHTLTHFEITIFMVGCLVGIGILSLPNDLMKTAKQDGWISSILGSVYPIYVVFISSFIIKKHPNENILSISKKYFGKFLGSFLNFLFMLQFFIYASAVANGFSNILRVYAVWFLTPTKILTVAFILAAYSASKGIKALARVNSIIFFITLALVGISTVALREGSFLNLSPVFGSGISNIIKGSVDTAFVYATMEILLIIHPFAGNDVDVPKAAYKSVFITTILYAWCVFIVIFYLGQEIIPKTIWSFIFVTESIKLPIINNFRYVFMFLWSLIIFKTISNEFFCITTILHDMTKIKVTWLCMALVPIMIFLSTLYKSETIRRAFLGNVIPKITIFNLTFITAIAILGCIKDYKSSKR